MDRKKKHNFIIELYQPVSTSAFTKVIGSKLIIIN